ncbi:scramblase [Myxococcota bacterium]|nr:scramblase [Myxococcota bacterium]MBU1431028.1 scramblase [Myxococcota bacterium]MBU1897114.1 scramblase [Myxococcota bacterium]
MRTTLEFAEMFLDDDLEALLGQRRRVFIRQRVEWGEAVFGFEQRNQYDVFDDKNELIGRVVEDQGALSRLLSRLFLGSRRGFEIDVRSHLNRDLLSLTRGFSFFFSEMDVWDTKGRRLGRVVRRFSLLYRQFDLIDERGHVFAYIKSPLWRLWTFPIFCVENRERGRITKRWSGLLKEMFSDADNFGVDFGEMPWTLSHRAVIFAAAISIDFDFFENNHK